ncbi:dienelactone hydrolase family protein [Undibacterium sp.]|jgi:predicted peptidase|uniref:carboxylesterase family protein n=1 Tax=Undibacterium sp. TaxID=1914977 RepID=UPI002C908686|nr:PHB depolymerase family esterase [Undibacterium sp.]HTD04630.1 PHB depolymerase family esterase [Undibacterium sp.]
MKIQRKLLAGSCLAVSMLHAVVAAADYPPQEKVAVVIDAARAAADTATLQGLKRDSFAAERFQPRPGVSLPYRLLKPASPQPGVRYPLVMVLHGSGAVGDDNVSQLGPFGLSWSAPAIQERFPAYILIPQFPERSANYANSEADGLLASQPGASLEIALQLLDDVVAHHAVDASRIYLTGFSMGASTAWNALLLRPDRFAAAVPFSGIPPARGTAAQLKDIPLLIVHGNADTENPIQPDREMYAALQKAGAKKVHFREYEGMEHRVPADMVLDARWREWLFAQRRAN